MFGKTPLTSAVASVLKQLEPVEAAAFEAGSHVGAVLLAHALTALVNVCRNAQVETTKNRSIVFYAVCSCLGLTHARGGVHVELVDGHVGGVHVRMRTRALKRPLSVDARRLHFDLRARVARIEHRHIRVGPVERSVAVVQIRMRALVDVDAQEVVGRVEFEPGLQARTLVSDVVDIRETIDAGVLTSAIESVRTLVDIFTKKE